MSQKCHHQHEFVLLEELLILDSLSQLVFFIIFFVQTLGLLHVMATVIMDTSASVLIFVQDSFLSGILSFQRVFCCALCQCDF